MYSKKTTTIGSKSKLKSNHELLDDIDDLQEMSKKWMQHSKVTDEDITEESSSQFQETETEDENLLQQQSRYQQHSLSQQRKQQKLQKEKQQIEKQISYQKSTLTGSSIYGGNKNTSKSNSKISDQKIGSKKTLQQQQQLNKQKLMTTQSTIVEDESQKEDSENIIMSQQSQQLENDDDLDYEQEEDQSSSIMPTRQLQDQSMTESQISYESEQILRNKKNISNNNPYQTKNNNNSDKYNTNKFKKRNHLPQIVDEDTEHFKVKLDHLINVFKADAISEFMGMKRSMLDDQKMQVKLDTEKYLSMYEEKSQELEQTKDMLAEQIKTNETLVERYEGFAAMCGQAKNRFHLQKNLGSYFNTLKTYKKYKAEKKQKKKFADHLYKQHLLKRIFNVWNKDYQESKQIKESEQQNQRQIEEIEDITAKYNKELEQIRSRLNETERQLQEANYQKQNMQDELKKAFMKGVCALNFEAMSILGNQNTLENSGEPNQQQLQQLQQLQQQQQQQQSQQQSLMNMSQQQQQQVQQEPQILQNTQSIANTISNMSNVLVNQSQQQQNTSYYNSNQSQNQSILNTSSNQGYQKQQESGLMVMNFDSNSTDQITNMGGVNEFDKENSPQKTMVFYQQPKIESKDHKWRDAPVVGVQKQVPIQKKAYESSLPDFVGQNTLKSTNLIQQQEEDDMNIDSGNGSRVVRITPEQKENSIMKSQNSRSKMSAKTTGFSQRKTNTSIRK